MQLSDYIAEVVDFPRPGIRFKDISPLLADARAFSHCIDRLADVVADSEPQLIAGVEARGFIFGAALAKRLGLGFVPLRKPGKLPGATLHVDYDLEYGKDRLELRAGVIAARTRVALIDDVLATGGTLEAAVRLLEQAGAVVASLAVVIEIAALQGRTRVPGARALMVV